MSDWPSNPFEPGPCISSLSIEGLGSAVQAAGLGLASLASATWPASSRALAVPVCHAGATSFVASQAFVHNGATVSGNFDFGVYDATFARLFSTGSTAQAGINDLQGVAAALSLAPDTLYYLALAFDGTVATVFRLAVAAPVLGAMGMVQMASAFPLPTTFVPALPTLSAIPLFGLSNRGFL